MGDRYRAVFQTALGVDETVDVAWRMLAAWLADAGFDAGDFGAGSRVLAADTELSYGHVEDGLGGTHRWTVDEEGGDGRRWTILTVYGPVPAPWLDDDPDAVCTWVWVERDEDGRAFPPAASDEDGRTERAVPPAQDLTRRLLAPLQASDGPADLRPEPVPVHARDVDRLITVLCDPERRLPVVVLSACARRSPEEWDKTVRAVTGPLAGLGGLYVLDRGATDRLCRQLGEDHWVNGGAIRTYYPLVDPASSDDAKRHPVISLRRLEEDLERAAGRIARELRRCVAQLELPRGLTVLLPAVGGSAGGGREKAVPVARVRSRLPIRTQDLRGPRRHAVPALEDVPGPGGSAAATGTAVVPVQPGAEAEAVAAEAAGTTAGADAPPRERLRPGKASRRRAEAERARTLRRQGARQEQQADAADGLADAPASFEAILARLPELSGVVFTGEDRYVAGLDAKQRNASWVRSAWAALLALDDYARARRTRGFAGDFRAWCEHPADGGRAINPRRVARRESGRVRTHARMREPRMLPVPTDVEPTGRVYMEEHVRIANTGRLAPRMHYYDDTASSGRVYIGYLGPHLRNTLTN